jgi:hypothetical protein
MTDLFFREEIVYMGGESTSSDYHIDDYWDDVMDRDEHIRSNSYTYRHFKWTITVIILLICIFLGILAYLVMGSSYVNNLLLVYVMLICGYSATILATYALARASGLSRPKGAVAVLSLYLVVTSILALMHWLS